MLDYTLYSDTLDFVQNGPVIGADAAAEYLK